jgi:flavin reductase (DIM6/NTAB) family NADH-FMN oxidoreductase RutF
MEIDPSTLPARDAYRWLTACLVPRPIAWVSTVDEGGRANLAPFSFFGGLTSDPPTVMVSVGRRRGARKDTGRNLVATREAVVHIAGRALAPRMVATSAEVGPEVDEFDLAGLTKVPARLVRPSRVAQAPIAMEARVTHHVEVGRGPVDVFLLELVRFHVDDALLVDGLPDPARLAAVGRLGGTGYCDTAAPFHLDRPSPRVEGRAARRAEAGVVHGSAGDRAGALVRRPAGATRWGWARGSGSRRCPRAARGRSTRRSTRRAGLRSPRARSRAGSSARRRSPS